MRKIGRPKSQNSGPKQQRRLSVSFSEKAWKNLNLVTPGDRSRFISHLLEKAKVFNVSEYNS